MARRLDNYDLATKRKRARATQYEIAERLGCSQGSISNFEAWARPLPNRLTRQDYEQALEAIVAERALVGV